MKFDLNKVNIVSTIEDEDGSIEVTFDRVTIDGTEAEDILSAKLYFADRASYEKFIHPN